MTLHLYEVDDGEQYWYVAESKEEATKMHLEPLLGYYPNDLLNIPDDHKKMMNCEVSEMEITEWEDTKLLEVGSEEDSSVVKKTAGEWAADGKGFIACTVW
jgi:hypothetical protein